MLRPRAAESELIVEIGNWVLHTACAQAGIWRRNGISIPISVNGLGLREAFFALYLSKLGQPLEAAVALSFMSYVLIAIFSMTGAAAYVSRKA